MTEEQLKSFCQYWRTGYWGRNGLVAFPEWVYRVKTGYANRDSLKCWINIAAGNKFPHAEDRVKPDTLEKLADNFYASLKREQ